MPLPIIAVPTYQLTIPSTQQIVKFRPFLVKEEKLLLMALEGNDEREINGAVNQVLMNCALTPVDPAKLATFDIEYFFLKLRAKSIGEVVNIPYRCQNVIAEGDNRRICNTLVPIQIDLDKVEVAKSDEHNPLVMLTDTVGVRMRYPHMELMRQVTEARKKENGMTNALRMIARCIDSVFDGSNVYDNSTLPELEEFLENLTQGQFAKIQKFFDTMPVLRHSVPFLCPTCGYKDTIVLEGMERFFA